MAASSKTCLTGKNAAIALLALWSVVSLIVIVVWATSPDPKSSAQCCAELEKEKLVWDKNKVALEELVEEAREKQDRQRDEILQLLGRLNATSAMLEECRQEKVSDGVQAIIMIIRTV